MAGWTAIEWADRTTNPLRARNRATGKTGHFCIRCNEGCTNCYAAAMQPFLGNPIRYAAQDIDLVELFLDRDALLAPLRWHQPSRVFWFSMTDPFLPNWARDWLDLTFAVMALTPAHLHMVLTKRPDRQRDYLADPGVQDRVRAAARDILASLPDQMSTPRRRARAAFPSGDPVPRWPLPNVVAGTSVHDQPSADAFLPLLIDTPAALRMVSAEPLKGPVTFRWAQWLRWKRGDGATNDHLDGLRLLDLVICGGESGRKARAMHPAWPRSLRDQCAEAGVRFFFKQWGEWIAADPKDEDVTPGHNGWVPLAGQSGPLTPASQFYPENGAAFVHRVGKKRAGRILDGRTHDLLPPLPGDVVAAA